MLKYAYLAYFELNFETVNTDHTNAHFLIKVGCLLCFIILKTKITRPVDCLDESTSSESILDIFKRHLRNKMGCLGVPVAFYGIYEIQNREALHLHALL